MMPNAAIAPIIAPAWWALLGGKFASPLFPVLAGGPKAVEDAELLRVTRVVVILEELEKLELDVLIVVNVDEFRVVDTPPVVTLK